MRPESTLRPDVVLLALLLVLLPLAWGCGGGGGTPPPPPPPAPTATGVAPTSGPIAGGTLITVTGTGFTAGGADVTVGGISCTGLTVVNDTTITCTTPAGVAAGAAPVVVTTAGGSTAPIPGGFTYLLTPAILVNVPPVNRVRIGDEFRFTITANDTLGPVSARLLNPLPGMQFDPSVSGVTPGSQQGRWVASRHAAGRHRLNFLIPSTGTTLAFDVRVYGTSDYTGTGTLIGDVTGDGIMDVVAGASTADAAAVDSGLVYVFEGGAAPASPPSAILFVPGATASDFLGGDAAAVPGTAGSGQLLQIADVTGDGVLDVIAAAPTADVTVVDDGAIYVWAGGAALTGGAVLPPDSTLVAGFGVAGDMMCGTKDGSQGLIIEEVTGDGILDVIGVAPFFDSVAVDAGAVFVWPGGPGLVGGGVTIAATGLAASGGPGGTASSFLGAANPFGPGVADGQGCQVADVTGDGINDIVACAKLDDVVAVDSGLCCVFAGGPALLGFPAPTANLFDPAAVAGDLLGHIADDGGLHLAEVTGDGTLDVVLGATFADVGAVDAGAILVWSGGAALAGAPPPTGVCGNLAAVGSDFMGYTGVLGATAGPRRGISIGDVTGDGTNDIVACGSFADTAVAVDAGAIYVFGGGAGLAGFVAPTAIGTDPFAVGGDVMGSNYRSGSSVNLVDVTGDGVKDIVVPGPGADIGAVVDEGQIYVFAGGAALSGAVTPDAYLGNPLGVGSEFVGRVNHAALMGNGHALTFEDVTGDGIRDVIAASPHVDVLGVDDGAVYLWNGGPALTGGVGLFPSATFSFAGTFFLGAADIFGFGGDGGVQTADVTGDGVLDIVVNDPAGTHLAMASAGVVYVWAGGPGIPVAPPPTASLGGGAPGDGLGLGSGFPVVFGDIDADGIDDVLVAGPDGFGGPPAGGHVFFWTGGAGIAGLPAPAVVMFDPLPPFFGSGIGSNFPYDFYNSQELFVADVTGDGICDVLGGDRQHSRAAGGTTEGAIHLWIGPALAPPPSVSFLDPLSIAGDQLGRVK